MDAPQAKKSDPDILRELQARMEIEQTLYSFVRFVDTGNPAGAAQLCTEDCEVDYGARAVNSVPLQGRLAYEAFLREVLSDRPVTADSLANVRGVARTIHHVSNISIEINGDRAEVQSWTHGLALDHSGKVMFASWAVFDDGFVRGPEGWRIARRRNRVLAKQEGASA
jgi:hypothetical protein